MVDSADKDRIQEARYELRTLIDDPDLRDAVVLVLANKQDMPYAMSADEVSSTLEMNTVKDKEWYVQPSNAITGEGLVEGLEWLHGVIMRHN